MVRTLLSLMLVMLLAGLWHGAMWGFVMWGGLHGALLLVERLFGWGRDSKGIVLRVLRILIVFILVQLLWVVFRADSVNLSMQYYTGLFNFSGLGSSSTSLLVMRDEVFVLLLICFSIVLFGRSIRRVLLRRTIFMNCIVIGLYLVCLIVLSEQSHNPFIYFRF